MEKKTVVFMLEYLRTGGWGAISDFITKFSERIPMNRSDTAIASSCLFKEFKSGSNFDLAKLIIKKREKFKKIERPEKIYDAGEEYYYVFFISVQYERLEDVVDLQSLYLLIDACDTVKAIALIEGIQKEYHKTSHFFSFLTERKGGIYESIFFKSDDIKHLQRAGIGTLSRFLPLIPVNRSTEKLFRQNVSEIITQEQIVRCLEGSKGEGKNTGIWAGALKKLTENRGRLKQCDLQQCAAYMGNVETLSFLLFCFFLDGIKEDFWDFGGFSRELKKISIWTNGCIQLIENIIFHSANQKGAFSFRLLESNNVYLKSKYGIGDDEKIWLELMVTDYPGRSHTRNIAQNFCENLAEDNIRSCFKGLSPEDFFAEGNKAEIDEAWRKYYLDKGNMVNHYGLRIFHKAVIKSNGYFIMQSHSTHIPREGERFCISRDIREEKNKICMPGTGYSVLFPIVREGIKREYIDYGIENYEGRLKDDDQFFDYEVIPKRLSIAGDISSAKTKGKTINDLAKEIGDNENSKSIVCINCENFPGNHGEIVYKAVILAMLKYEKNFHVVLYGCHSEFVQVFLTAAYLGWQNLKEESTYNGKKQIALYTAGQYEEIRILPENWYATLELNRKNNFSRETRWADYFEKWDSGTAQERAKIYVANYPFDVVATDEQGNTIFEKYVETVIERNIQSEKLGCKIENVHMRLGSTIHVNHFYEAEILFGNFYFVERFAMLMIKSMCRSEEKPPIQSTDKVTLYGYSNYSEHTVYCTMQFLRRMLPGIDVDYAILEREAEERGFTHVDRIRYSTYFEEGEDEIKKRKEHFRSRKIVCIIPIASTLKTNEKMINLFAEENGKETRDAFWHNFELILVGSAEDNEYWEKKGKRISGKKGMEISPEPEFFVEVALTYMEPLKCNMCFPKCIIDEQPLVEVNAASTIPNQAFGLIEEKCGLPAITRDQILQEEEKMEILKDILIYRHIEKNENHFLFYFQSERLLIRYSEKIRDWLKGIGGEIKKSIAREDYVVLFCPAHFSNAGFVECVNNYVFGSAAVVIRDDVDKEYRCNFKTKFSNMRKFVEKIAKYQSDNGERQRRIHFFYVDETIVTGNTFQRAKSLVQSVIGDYVLSERQKYVVFEGIFVLIDRNSRSSRWQYTGLGEEERLYAFRTIHISSVRNHGDACVYCNLAKEAETLKRSSVTKTMEKYWESEEEKFSVKPLVRYLRYGEESGGQQEEVEKKQEDVEKKKKRAFRRLCCTNNAMVFLKDEYHGNQKEVVLEQLLTLILEGSAIHAGEEAEYFLSYCKVLSRPFRVFDKGVKEAVFDFLLVACQSALAEEPYGDIIKSSVKKPYLRKENIKLKLLDVERFVQDYFRTGDMWQDLLKVLLKQLTEMKSNFILRETNMRQILEYANGLNEGNKIKFLQYYKCLTKRLTGISSDTSKCLWLDNMLRDRPELLKQAVPQDIYLENVWIYQDAFQKLNGRIRSAGWAEILESSSGDISEKNLARFEREELEEHITPYQFKDFIKLLELYGLREETAGFCEEGRVFVAANYLLYKFISQEFTKSPKKADPAKQGNLDKVDHIAACIKHIIKAKDVVIMMEFNAEYDLWESKLIERYNALMAEPQGKIKHDLKKEYLVLGSSGGRSKEWTIKESEAISLVQKVQNKKGLTEKEYSFSLKEGTFLWEVGHTTEYPVYIFARWEGSEQGSMAEIDRLNRIRSVLQYCWMLNDSVFNKGNEVFFYEIARQRKQNAIQSMQKAYTHTKSDIRMEQYIHMLNKKKYNGYFQSELLMLLADLNVSEHYRKSLTMDYYLEGIPMRPERWNSELSLFKDMNSFYILNSDDEKATELKVSKEVLFEGDIPLQGDEEVIALDYTNAERETFLLIYSLMVNAVTDGRGFMENNCVTVYCTKTAGGRLRLANRIGAGAGVRTPEQIMEGLRYPPEEEGQGISLWSMSRYIKRMIANYLNTDIKKLERSAGDVDPASLILLGNKIKKMMGEEFRIDIRKEKVGDKEYFSVLLPVFAEKYYE